MIEYCFGSQPPINNEIAEEKLSLLSPENSVKEVWTRDPCHGFGLAFSPFWLLFANWKFIEIRNKKQFHLNLAKRSHAFCYSKFELKSLPHSQTFPNSAWILIFNRRFFCDEIHLNSFSTLFKKIQDQDNDLREKLYRSTLTTTANRPAPKNEKVTFSHIMSHMIWAISLFKRLISDENSRRFSSLFLC